MEFVKSDIYDSRMSDHFLISVKVKMLVEQDIKGKKFCIKPITKKQIRDAMLTNPNLNLL